MSSQRKADFIQRQVEEMVSQPRDVNPRAFKFSSDGFTLNCQNANGFYKWTNILEVKAYKRDLFTIDTLCLDITFSETVLTLSEDLDGWSEFVDMLGNMLPGVLQKWEAQVVETPFAANETIIYRREVSSRNGG